MQRTVTWTLPPVGPRQRPLIHTLIEYRVQVVTGQPPLDWTLQDTISATGEQKLVIDEPPIGTMEYQLTVVDVDGRRGPPAIASKARDADAPGAITGITIVDA